MVVDRRHQEHPPPRALEVKHLDDHRKRLDHEEPAHDRQHDLVLGDDRHSAQRAADGQLINGSGAGTGIPVVWGISATVDRFTKAMEGAKGRTGELPAGGEIVFTGARASLFEQGPAEGGKGADGLLKGVSRVLQPGGVVIIKVPN